MVARSSSDASTYSSAETRREIKIPKGGGGGELGACALGSSNQNVVKVRGKALVGTLAFVVSLFSVSLPRLLVITQHKRYRFGQAVQ